MKHAVQSKVKAHQSKPGPNVCGPLVTFLQQLLAVALVEPRHLELGALETHGAVELHEAKPGPHVEGIREGCEKHLESIFLLPTHWSNFTLSHNHKEH